jgi:hypothetical protein
MIKNKNKSTKQLHSLYKLEALVVVVTTRLSIRIMVQTRKKL